MWALPFPRAWTLCLVHLRRASSSLRATQSPRTMSSLARSCLMDCKSQKKERLLESASAASQKLVVNVLLSWDKSTPASWHSSILKEKRGKSRLSTSPDLAVAVATFDGWTGWSYRSFPTLCFYNFMWFSRCSRWSEVDLCSLHRGLETLRVIGNPSYRAPFQEWKAANESSQRRGDHVSKSGGSVMATEQSMQQILIKPKFWVSWKVTSLEEIALRNYYEIIKAAKHMNSLLQEENSRFCLFVSKINWWCLGF